MCEARTAAPICYPGRRSVSVRAVRTVRKGAVYSKLVTCAHCPSETWDLLKGQIVSQPNPMFPSLDSRTSLLKRRERWSLGDS